MVDADQEKLYRFSVQTLETIVWKKKKKKKKKRKKEKEKKSFLQVSVILLSIFQCVYISM